MNTRKTMCPKIQDYRLHLLDLLDHRLEDEIKAYLRQTRVRIPNPVRALLLLLLRIFHQQYLWWR